MAYRSEAEQDKLDKEYNARKKRRHEKRLKKLKSIVLSQSDKDDLARARKRISQRAKHAVGKKQPNYDPGNVKVTDIVRDVQNVNDWEKHKKRKFIHAFDLCFFLVFSNGNSHFVYFYQNKIFFTPDSF